MRKTTNYELNIAEGSDRYNHLTIDNPNYEKIDTTMKENEDSAVQTATELKSGTVHAITRNKPNASMFRFVATSDFTSGETFTVDGQQVTALLPNGATLGTGAYHINANVLCCLVGTNMTVYTVGTAENIDATTLDGHSVDYFATATALDAVKSTAESAGIVANAANTTANEVKNEVVNKAPKQRVLWKNESPESPFSGQTINLNGNYDFITIVWSQTYSNRYEYSITVPKSDGTQTCRLTWIGVPSLKEHNRDFTFNGSSVVFGNDNYEQTNTIPIVIIG